MDINIQDIATGFSIFLGTRGRVREHHRILNLCFTWNLSEIVTDRQLH
jgi:hypothetical protein